MVTSITISSSIFSHQLVIAAFVAVVLLVFSSTSTSSSRLLFASAQLQDDITYFVMDGDSDTALNFTCSLGEAQCIFQETDFSSNEPIVTGGGSLENVDDSGFIAWIVADPETNVLTLAGCASPADAGTGGDCIIACDQACTCVLNTTDADSCLQTTRFPTAAPGGGGGDGSTVAPTLVPTMSNGGDGGGGGDNGTNTDNDDDEGMISFEADMMSATFVCTSVNSECNFLRSNFDKVDAQGGTTSGAPDDERVWKVSNPETDALTLNVCKLTEGERCIVTCTSNCTCANAADTACVVRSGGGGEPGTVAPTNGGTNNDGNSTPPEFVASDVPSSVPTVAPSASGSGGGNETLASDMPSDQPSSMPAAAGGGNVSSDMPTPSDAGGGDGASDRPSDMPSAIPANTVAPTVVANNNSTKAPTLPLDGTPEKTTFLQVQMTLDGVFLMEKDGIGNWTKTTTDFYHRVYNTDVDSSSSRLLISSSSSSWSSPAWLPNNNDDTNNINHHQRHNSYRELLEKEGIFNFTTNITYVDQIVAGVTNTITYTQTISYLRTMEDAPSSWDLITGPFQDAALNAQYTQELRKSNPAFESLMDKGVGGPSQETAEPPASEPVSKEASNNALSPAAIAGIAVGGFLGLLCCCCGCIAVYMLLRDQRSAPQNMDDRGSSRRGDDDDRHGDGSNSRSNSRNEKFGNERHSEKDDRRLGPLDEEEDEGSFHNDSRLRDHDSVDNADYNFDSAFGHEDDNERSIGIDHDDDDDDDRHRGTGRSGEQIIEVDAPPGPLGVVVDTPDEDGPPVVHDIADSSPLFGKLQEGDKLIAVDGEDVSDMTATDVSALIGSKATNRHRYLRVIRSTGGGGGSARGGGGSGHDDFSGHDDSSNSMV